jgi:hypothetical protein
MRLFKEPFIQFVVLGALIFVAYNFSQTAEQAGIEKKIEIDAPTQTWMYDNFVKQFQRTPTRIEMGHLIKAHIEQEVKYRHALAMGLDDKDSIVRRRMTQKMDFLFGNGASDLIPDDSTLHEWYEANPDEFTTPATVSFTHLWFSPDNRGANAKTDAAAALVLTRKNEQPTGDRFPFDVEFSSANFGEVRNVLGPKFATTVFELPSTTWSGPIQSGLGYHLVYVSEKTLPTLAPLEEVRDLAIQSWREDESARIFEELIANLKAEFEVNIDEDALIQFDYAPDDEVPPQ